MRYFIPLFILLMLTVPASAQTHPPSLAFSIGGPGNDVGLDIALDTAGNVYVTGRFQATVDFDSGPEVLTRMAQGDYQDLQTGAAAFDAFLAKYDSAGVVQWVVSFGGAGGDLPHALAVHDDAVYIIGYFSSRVDFSPVGGGVVLDAGVGRDAFIVKFNTSGEFQWAIGLGDMEANPRDGQTREEGLDITTDLDGNVYATGVFNGTIDFDPSDGQDAEDTFTSFEGTRDTWFASYTPNGDYRWGRSFGGFGWEAGHGIRVGREGAVYVVGSYGATMDFDPGPEEVIVDSPNNWDVYLVKYSAAGDFLWVITFGDDVFNDSVRPGGMAIDQYDNIYLAGDIGVWTDFDPTDGEFILEGQGADVFVAQFSSGGELGWALNMGGLGPDWAAGLALAAGGDVVVTGEFMGLADFDPGPPELMLQGVNNATNIFVGRYASDGKTRWVLGAGASEPAGGQATNHGLAVAVNPVTGEVWVTGRFHGELDMGGVPLSSAGRADAFVMRLPG